MNEEHSRPVLANHRTGFMKIPEYIYRCFLFFFTRLDDAQKKLDQTKTKSATTLLATEEEILQLKSE